MKFVYGLIAIGVGFLLIRYTYGFVTTFGKIPWAENKLGGMGGTFTLYKVVGVIFIILAFMYMFGGMDWLIRPLAPLFSPPK